MNRAAWTLGPLALALTFGLGCRGSGGERAPATQLTGPQARAQMSSKERHDRLVDYLPNIDLVDHTGTAVRFYDDVIYDKVVLINFMYTSCDGI